MDAGEELLAAWLKLTVSIRGNRILKGLSLNEIMALRAIISEGGPEGLNAKMVGERLRLLKSQTHNVLRTLEDGGLVELKRGERDQRTIYALATPRGREVYSREHGQVMELIRAVEEKLGEDNCRLLTALTNKAIDAAGQAAGRYDHGKDNN